MAEQQKTINFLQILDLFNHHYNHTYGTKGSMFEGLNEKDTLGTNNKMEQFHKYQLEHKTLEDTDIYIEDNIGEKNIYCLTINTKNIKRLYSNSFISLLFYVSELIEKLEKISKDKDDTIKLDWTINLLK
jgi:hypothetical protein